MSFNIATNLINLPVIHRDDKINGKIIGVAASYSRNWTFSVHFDDGTESDQHMFYLLFDGKGLESHLISLGFDTSNPSHWLSIRKLLGNKRVDEENLERLKRREERERAENERVFEDGKQNIERARLRMEPKNEPDWSRHVHTRPNIRRQRPA